MSRLLSPAVTLVFVALASPRARAGEVPVADVAGLVSAIQAAQAGDTIVLAPGTYEVHQSKIACAAAGTADAPIVVQAAELGTVTIRFDAVEGFHVRGPHWEFANLDIEGICANDSDCEHAFHVTGAAEHTWLHHNRMHGFNAMIKGNGEPIGPGDSFVWPDDVVIEYNELYNPAPRDTSNPVTPIDIVGGQRWVLRGNFIHDHAKGGGDNVSYAAFLKGHSKDGLIERNLVVCELLHSGQVRLGLSLGGGGTGPDSICEDGACKPEHERGILRNNLIVNCPADVGIYVNAGADSKIVNNTLFNTAGIDMRFAQTTGLVANNLMNGKIRDRDGGSSMKMNNLSEVTLGDFGAWFVDAGAFDFTLKDGAALVDLGLALPEVTDDYCGNLRDDGTHDIGAIEYDGDGCVGGVPVEAGSGGGETTGGETAGETAGETGGPGQTSDVEGSTTSGETGSSPTGGASSPTSGANTTTEDSDGGALTSGQSSGSDGATDSGAQNEDGGCGCRGASGSRPGAWLLGLMLLGLRRRRG
ncbi:MAG: right-handed parallel beta-helix repeat-containing protein [Nannocystis sp.]|nr:chondroitinase-B domain-containing protein [Nannocystis sp.]MBA3547808.1 right-handed parallel beta-helix repeat-containing protein [Nannocystis sp.]